MTNGPPLIFDRALYARRRARGARRGGDMFLAVEAATRLAERIAAVNRRFETALALNLRPQSMAILHPLAERWIEAPDAARLVTDEEFLPFADESFSMIVSVLSLHAVNDLPGTLLQIRRALKPDGLFMAALFGGETLRELRAAFATGESETLGGISPRVAPFADVRELGGLLQRAGFALPVADSERTIVRYRGLDGLVDDLRALGETNALAGRLKRPLRRNTLKAVLEEYRATHCDGDGRFRATFDIVYLAGWAPHESQQKPLKPGSARARLADALGTHEYTDNDSSTGSG